MDRAGFTEWLSAPKLSGGQALLCGIAALAVPTLIRAAVQGVISGCEFTPYLPSVLICALLLTWWEAGMVAFGSVALLGFLFDGPTTAFLKSACFESSAGIFLASSAALIAIGFLFKRTIAALVRNSNEASGGIIFSLEKGEVWASWNGNGPPVRLGNQHNVAPMMEDFLAQVELGKRLNRGQD